MKMRAGSFSACIPSEYGEIRSIFLYSVRMAEKAGKMQTRIPPNTDTFYKFPKFNIYIRIIYEGLPKKKLV